MAISTSYDPETLAFLADQAAWSSGRKTYSPVPRSRIPSTPRIKKVRKPADPLSTSAVTGPTYLLSVPPGKERVYYQRLQQHVANIRVFLPLTYRQEPVYPGWLFITIPDAVYAAVTTLLKEWRWGFLNDDPVPPDLVNTLELHAHDVPAMQQSVGPFNEEHPLWQLAQALIHHYGWHGTWNELDGWQLQTAKGIAIEHASWDGLWLSLYTAWQAGTPMEEIVRLHHDDFVGIAFPITLYPGPAQKDWVCEWLGIPGTIPAAEHRGIHTVSAQPTTGWGVLLRGGSVQFSLVHQDLARQLIAYRMPIRDILRVPGERTVLCVPQLSDVARMHARQISKSLGWKETWGVVSSADPRQLINKALGPKHMQFFREEKLVTTTGIPKSRQVWVDRINQWLAPDWTIVG